MHQQLNYFNKPKPQKSNLPQNKWIPPQSMVVIFAIAATVIVILGLAYILTTRPTSQTLNGDNNTLLTQNNPTLNLKK